MWHLTRVPFTRGQPRASTLYEGYCSRSIRFIPFSIRFFLLWTHLLPTSFTSRRRLLLKIQCKFFQKFHDFVKRVSLSIYFSNQLLRINFQEINRLYTSFYFIYICVRENKYISPVFPRNPLPSSRRITSHAVPNGGWYWRLIINFLPIWFHL